MSQWLKVVFANQSRNRATAIVYQKDPNPSDAEYSLVWLSAKASVSQYVDFQWEPAWSFVWGAQNRLQPGVIITAHESQTADLPASNAITLEYKNFALQFTNQRRGPAQDKLLITNSGTVPMDAAVEGIAMSGKPATVIQAQPNTDVLFGTQPEYWMAFGVFSQGEVLEPQLMTEGDGSGARPIFGKPVRLPFTAQIRSLQATLNADNTWDIVPGSS